MSTNGRLYSISGLCPEPEPTPTPNQTAIETSNDRLPTTDPSIKDFIDLFTNLYQHALSFLQKI